MKKILTAVVLTALLLTIAATAFAATGLGSVTTVTNTSATAEKNGSVSGYVYMCAVTLDAEGKVAGVVFDAVQPAGSFDATGTIVGEASVVVETKNEIKEGYGMKAISPIGKEWYEQMEAFSAWCVGKTPAEILATPLNEKGVATDVDLVAGCTVHINDQLVAFEKAVANAK